MERLARLTSRGEERMRRTTLTRPDAAQRRRGAVAHFFGSCLATLRRHARISELHPLALNQRQTQVSMSRAATADLSAPPPVLFEPGMIDHGAVASRSSSQLPTQAIDLDGRRVSAILQQTSGGQANVVVTQHQLRSAVITGHRENLTCSI